MNCSTAGIPEMDEDFKSYMENIPAGMIVVDDHGTIQHANSFCETVFHLKRDEIVGKGLAIDSVQDVTERNIIQSTLIFLTRYGYINTKENFFESLARYLAETLEVDYVCIDRLQGDCLSAKTVAIYFDGKFEDNVEYTLMDTPCGDVVGKRICTFPHKVRTLFPKDIVLQDMLAESYVGTTLFGYEGRPIGLIAIISRKKLKDMKLAEMLLELVSVRAAGEIERIIATEEILREKEKAIAANAIKGQFLANMSHELRTPMNGIIGMTDLTLMTQVNEEQKSYLNVVKSSTKVLLGVLNDILDYSKIEAGKIMLEKLAFRLEDTISEVMDLFRPSADQKGLRFLLEYDERIPNNLFGDAVRLKQIMSNLIGNAVKFTSYGHIAVRILRLEGEEKTTRLRFEIEDTGIGIPSDKLEKLFIRFSQVDESVTRVYGGSGLGLAISKALVEMMDGEIGVESKDHEGSKFFFTAVFEVQQIASGTEYIEKLKLPKLSFTDKRTVLIAEDDYVCRQVVKSFLEKNGFPVLEATDGQAAVKAYESSNVSLILMDVNMPVLDGYSATAEIRRREKNRGVHMPIIAVTAYALSGDREKCLVAGMDDYISKPIDFMVLIQKLNLWLPKIMK